MINWWNGLQLVQQIFAIFAIPATLILAIQTVLLLLGLGGDHDTTIHDGGVHDGNLHDTAGLDGGNGHLDGGHADVMNGGHAHIQDAGLRLFTVRGLIAFFAVGGWAGIALIDLGLHPVLASLLALAAGLLALVFIAWLFRLMLGLQSSGNLDISNAIGLVGDVYLRIPPNMQGSGKVSLILQGRSIEIDALTEAPAEIETGRQVTVVGRRGDRLVVRPLP